MKRRILLFLFIILHFTFHIRLSAQDTWVQTYQPFGDGNYQVEDVLICDGGGYTVNGYYYYFDGFDQYQWGYLMKTDIDGNFLWAKKDTISWISETESSAFVQTDDGGYLSAVFSHWGGTALIKRDSEGGREWVVDGQDLYIHSMDKDNNGDIILAGRMNGLPAMRKIEQNGNILWTQNYAYTIETDGCINSVFSASDNGYLATGYVDKYDTGEIDVLVVKTNENGDSLWTKTFDGYNQHDGGASIIENSFNRLLVSGSFGYQMSFMSFITEITAEGDTLWMMQYEGSSGIGGAALIEIISEGYILYNSKITKINYYQEIVWSEILPGSSTRGCKTLNDGFVCARRIDINWDEYIGLVKTDEEGQYTVINNNLIKLIDSNIKCYPNPFNPNTTISFNINEPTKVKLNIFNIKGQKIKTLINDFRYIGEHIISWDSTDETNLQVSSGIYFIVLTDENQVICTKKITLIK